ncbi:XdhC family protein [Neosynechococcus sphagnicola]|uniref:XdhC family protein n=1 Tax=Neosynechococcus sphagnicola TaxID=1501145 RepID=UPI000ABCBC1A|nr:XdhC family protein [Neosynechococcus sphagnicola]
MTTLDFYRQLAQNLIQTAVVVATVSRVSGSVPREVGAKMIIFGQGDTHGTIGGGAGEAKVIQQAMGVLSTGIAQPVEIDLSGAPQRPTEGICGGQMQVWLAPWSGIAAIALVRKILAALEAGESAILVTPLTTTQRPYLVAVPPPPSPDALVEILTPPPPC